MKIEKRLSLRKRIDEKCKTCTYDRKAAGTWRQQVTLCPIADCALYSVRPTTNAPIPDSVLHYYLVADAGRARYARSRHQEGLLSEHNEGIEYRRQSSG